MLVNHREPGKHLDSSKPAAAGPTVLRRSPGSDFPGSDSLPCAGCQQTNAADRRFCSSCGLPLWQACPQCGSESGLHEVFCGKCGANVRELIASRIAQIDTALARARELQAAGNPREALRALHGLPAGGQPVVARRLDEARQLTAELQAEDLRWRQLAEEVTARAEQLVKSHQYREVLQCLQTVPLTYLDDRGRQWLGTAAATYEEIRKLRAEIAADVEARKLLELSPKIERYLALQPGEQKIRELAGRVAEYVCKKAREALAQSDFEKAHALLGQAPVSGRSAEVQELAEEIRENRRLHYEVRHAAAADARLVAIAERLRQRSAGVANIDKVLSTLRLRLQSAAVNSRFPLVPWAPAPKRTWIGKPVEFLGGFRRLRPIQPDACPLLRSHPGQFFVACGLALQGLGKGRLTCNLVSSLKPRSLLSKIGVFSSKPTVRAAWGLDVGGSSLKAVKLAVDAKSGEVLLEACERIPLGEETLHPESARNWSRLVGQALQQFRQKFTPADDELVCANLPSNKTLARFFAVPSAKEKKFAEIVQYESSHQLPVPLAELAWGYDTLGEAFSEPADAGVNPHQLRRVVLTAVRLQDLRERMDEFEQAGLRLDLLQADGVALHNFLAYDEFDAFSNANTTGSPAADSRRTVALLDVGADASQLVFTSRENAWFRSFRLAGSDVNQLLSRDLKVTFGQAEELKRLPAPASPLGKVLDSIEPWLVRLGGEVQRTFDNFHRDHPEQIVESLWLCGGGSLQYGLLRYLRSGAPPLG